MYDWKAETAGLTPLLGRTRSTIMKVVGAAVPIGTLLVSEINVGKSIPLGVENTVILYGG